MTRKKKFWILVIVILLLVTPIPLFYFSLGPLGSWLLVEDEPRPCDLIIAHAGDRVRIEYAKQLFLRGMGKKLVLSFDIFYAKAVYGLEDLDLAENALKKLQEGGVPAEDIIVFKEGTSSYDEILWVRSFWEKNRFESAIVVSNQYHMRRLSMTYDHVFPEKEVVFLYCPTPWEMEGITPREWWKRERELLWVSKEYLKLVFYQLKHF
jgi:uncharacterized SAM-binding protein YcdF (DUF218 family)